MAASDFTSPTQESIWKVTRQLKKEQLSLYNCVASVLSDAAFVSEIRGLYPTVPLLANLRCGLWYTRQADGTCYFKSTDGHNGNWSFSSTRLNWNVCELAAAHGGVIIVDATRKGKRFPDAMTKTIPIWAAVVNRAIARKRAEAAALQTAAAAAAEEAATAAAAAAAEELYGQGGFAPAHPHGEEDSAYAYEPGCIGEGAEAGAPGAPGSNAVACPLLAAAPSWRSRSGLGSASSPCLINTTTATAEAESCARVGSLSMWLPSPTGLAAAAAEAAAAASSPSGLAAATGSPGPSRLGQGSPEPWRRQRQGQGRRRSSDGGVVAEAVGEVWGAPMSPGPEAPAPAPAGSSIEGTPAGAVSCCCVGSDATQPVYAGACAGAEPPAARPSCNSSGTSGCDGVTGCGVGGANGVPCADPCAAGVAAASAAAATVSHGSGNPEPELECSVDLAAASASHVSCSPEEGWRRCCAFGPVVECGCGYGEEAPAEPLLGAPGGQCAAVSGGRGRGVADQADADGGSSDACTARSAVCSAFSSASGSASGSDSSSSGAASRSSSSCSDASDGGSGGDAVGRGARSRRYGGARSCWASPVRRAPCPSDTSSICQTVEAAGYRDPAAGATPCGGCGSSSASNTGGGGAAAAPAGAAPAAAATEWDERLHLPLWISSNERAQIEARLDGWVEALLRVGADVEGMAQVLRKPLRPLWISQSSTIWVDQVAQPDQLPFTPLYLVSASQPHSYVRQAGAASDDDAGGDGSDGGEAAALPSGCGAARPQRQRRARQQGAQHHQHQQQRPHAWTYMYVPGAGDDEESWAAGLTPAVFWAHYPRLLRAGPAGVHDTVRALLQQEAAALAQHGANSSIVATHGSTGTPVSAFAAAASVDEEPIHASPSSAAAGYVATTDEHHLLPAGCRRAAASAVPTPGPCGMYFLGCTRIALGDLAAGAAPECWRAVDAVLSCGPQQHPSMAAEPQWQAGAWYDGGHGAGGQQEEGGEGAAGAAGQQHAAQECGVDGCDEGFTFKPPVLHHRHHHHRHNHHYNRHLSDQQQQPHLAARQQPPSAPRFLHLPVAHFKHARSSLMEQLDAALRFASHHLARGRTVLIHDTNGLDTCVCIAVALLLSCYGPCGGADASGPAWLQPYAGAASPAGDPRVTKDAVRQRLAYVSGCYPPARPTRGMLRQVFNHFAIAAGARGGAAGGEADEEAE